MKRPQVPGMEVESEMYGRRLRAQLLTQPAVNLPDSNGMANLVRDEAVVYVFPPLPCRDRPGVRDEPGCGYLGAVGPRCWRVHAELAHPLDFDGEDAVSAGHVRDDVFPSGGP